jgi:GDP-L-fucose synthase
MVLIGSVASDGTGQYSILVGEETHLENEAKIFVAGHRGLVGSAIVRCLRKERYARIITRSRDDLDLTDRAAVDRFLAAEQPEYVFLAAAKVGGILANVTYPADFLYQNLAIQTNLIDSAARHGVRKLQFLGSSCIYPKFAPQPIREEHLLTGSLEPTNEWYAMAKISGLKMCQAYHRQYGFRAISLMPTNLYGPGDNFSLETSHVLPALIRKFDTARRTAARQVVLWGTGTPRREFLHVDDLASACLFLMKHYEDDAPVNVGVGEDLTIRELAELVREVVGADVEIVQDTSKPDGTPRKLLDVSRVNALGWKASIALEQGIRDTYQWFTLNRARWGE